MSNVEGETPDQGRILPFRRLRVVPSLSPDTGVEESLAAMGGNLMGGSVEECLPDGSVIQQGASRPVFEVLPGGQQKSADSKSPNLDFEAKGE